MKKLFLLDAYALIYRAYYAFIRMPRVNSKGENTSAAYGFINTLEEVLRKEQPTHIAVAFDPSGPTFRHEEYPAYKAQREATPEDIKSAVPVIKELLEAYRIPIIEVPGFEADDVIGTMAKIAEKQGFETYMLTPDKDYGQLVSQHSFMYRPRHGGGYEVLGVEGIKEKFSIASTDQVIDFLGLMGDSSDNIPGCPGVGQKTAVKLLNEFGSIENLLQSTDKLKGALKKKVEENKEQIIFSRYLATIKTDVPLTFDEDELLLKGANEARLLELFEQLEFRNFIARRTGKKAAAKKKPADKGPKQASLFDFIEEAEAKELAAKEAEEEFSSLASLATTKHDYQLIDTPEKRSQLAKELSGISSFCLDTETTGIDVFEDELLGISLSWEKNKAYYLPVSSANLAEIQELFQPIFSNEEVEKVGQNLKFDLQVLAQNGIVLKGKLFDTMIAHYLLHPELRHNMDYMAEVYLAYQCIHYEELVGPKGKKQKNLKEIAVETVADYAAEDADITLQLKELLAKELVENGLEELFYDMEMPLMRCLSDMEQGGVRIDAEALRSSSSSLTAYMHAIVEEVHAMSGTEFNLSSAKQVGEVLFDRLKIVEKAKKTKTGQYSTSEEVLQKLKGKHEIVAKILEYRGLKKLLSTYIDALPALVKLKTGKIHTSYNQTVTVTGRLSSSNPNLQNIPIRDEQGKEIRKAFIPDEGCLFLSADYSQVELRIMAHLSGDTNMIEAFKAGLDIHAATAAKIYKLPINELEPDMRRKAKTANFGIIYGISVFGLGERLNIPRAEAKQLIDGYFASYPQVKAYMDASIEKAKENGYVETLFSRKRYLADIHSANANVRGFAERNAINAPIQGSAADIIKIAMIRIANRLKAEGLKSKMNMQVHDELNFSVLPEELEQVKALVVEEMEGAAELSVPLVVDCGVGENWLQAH